MRSVPFENGRKEETLTADEKEKSSRNPAVARSEGAMSLCVTSDGLVIVE